MLDRHELRCAAWRSARAAMLRAARRHLPVSAAECAAQIGREVGESCVDRAQARNLAARAALRSAL